jgi:hypothetical protein
LSSPSSLRAANSGSFSSLILIFTVWCHSDGLLFGGDLRGSLRQRSLPPVNTGEGEDVFAFHEIS